MVDLPPEQPRQNKANFRAWSFVRNKANFGALAGWPQGLVVRTKPIGGGGRLCKTNPISAGAAWDEAPGAWDAGQSCETKPISGSSGFSVLVGCRPPSRGRCPRTPGICRFGPIAWQEDPEARLSCGADFRAALAATPGRPAGPSPSTPKELACPAVFIMLLAKSVKCRGLGRSPKRYRSTLKPDEPIFPDAT